MPQELIDSWSGENAVTGEKYDVSFHVTGFVVARTIYDENRHGTTFSGITGLERVGDHLFRYQLAAGEDASALIVGGGIGGHSVKFDHGIRIIDANTIQPVIWQASITEDFNYANPLPGPLLTRRGS
ncbi:hypothetical protein [Streptococcus marmotae]|uniref:hypothetical protein n=1 Tax=Streptococcus marmotae TaxID=1825069 RepID=UPI000834D2CF|nr:hypothetical protein [Streptococcus marmotae]